MKKLASLSAFLAVAAVATPFSQALAATVLIEGDTYTGFVGYGSSVNKHNVVNGPNSGLSTQGWANPWKSGGSVLSTVQNYEVDWYFNGAESGNTNMFSSMSLTYTEHDQNNSYNFGNDPGWKKLGTTTGSGLNAPIPFQVTDTDFSTGATVVNGANQNPGPSIASLIFSYAKPKFSQRTGKLIGWKLTTQQTDWFVFAFDDPGSTNDDHDDYVGVAFVRGLPPSPVPIPGALPLMGSVMGGGYLYRRWRNSRRKKAGAGHTA